MKKRKRVQAWSEDGCDSEQSIVVAWSKLSNGQKSAIIPRLLDMTPSWHVAAMDDISAITWIRRQLKMAGL